METDRAGRELGALGLGVGSISPLFFAKVEATSLAT